MRGAFVATGAGDFQSAAIVADFGAILAHIVPGGSDGGGVDRLGIGHGRGQNRGEDGGGNSGEDELAHGGNSLFRPALAKCLGVSVGHEPVMVRRG
jgi:hypothetical protein